MATMNVSLPDEMKEWVESQAASGRYGNVSDYVRELIRLDMDRVEGIARLQAAIDRGRAGPFRTFSSDEELLAEITSRGTKLKKPNAA